MFRITCGLAVPAVVLLMIGTAHAALTADQVWQSWKDAGALIGVEVKAATENKDGAALTLNGITVAPAGMSGVSISDMVLTEAADGSVAIVPGADIKLDLVGDTKGTSKVVHEGLTLTASEADGGISYDMAATKLDVVYDVTYPAYPSFDGTVPPEVAAKGTVTLADLIGTYSDIPGDLRSFGLDLAVSSLAYDTSLDDPSLELKQQTKSSTSDMSASLELSLPAVLMAGGDPSMVQALTDGLSLSFASEQGETTGSVVQDSPYFAMTVGITAGASEATGVFNKDELSLESSGTGFQLDFTSPMSPEPIVVTSGPVEVSMSSPVIATDAAGEFGLVLKMSQFALNEAGWAMFDPAAGLPRDAADLAVDVSGTTKIDLAAIIDAEETGAEPPMPAPETLDITEMTLKVAGAALAGTGAFTFDNTAGTPMPLGEANVILTGSTQLIEGLIGTGLITAEDAMGVQMMMSGFMSPGAGEDELTSKIEAKAGGEIYVNGQRIQ